LSIRIPDGTIKIVGINIKTGTGFSHQNGMFYIALPTSMGVPNHPFYGDMSEYNQPT